MRVDRQSRGEDGRAKTCLSPSENPERLPKKDYNPGEKLGLFFIPPQAFSTSPKNSCHSFPVNSVTGKANPHRLSPEPFKGTCYVKAEDASCSYLKIPFLV